MALRFCDHCVPFSVTKALREAGHEAARLRDHMPKTATDPDVLAKAAELDAILISLDGDFCDIITFPPAEFQGIIGLQIHNHPEVIPRIMSRLLDYCARYQEPDHDRGRLFLIEPHRIRIR